MYSENIFTAIENADLHCLKTTLNKMKVLDIDLVYINFPYYPCKEINLHNLESFKYLIENPPHNYVINDKYLLNVINYADNCYVEYVIDKFPDILKNNFSEISDIIVDYASDFWLSENKGKLSEYKMNRIKMLINNERMCCRFLNKDLKSKELYCCALIAINNEDLHCLKNALEILLEEKCQEYNIYSFLFLFSLDRYQSFKYFIDNLTTLHISFSDLYSMIGHKNFKNIEYMISKGRILDDDICNDYCFAEIVNVMYFPYNIKNDNINRLQLLIDSYECNKTNKKKLLYAIYCNGMINCLQFLIKKKYITDDIKIDYDIKNDNKIAHCYILLKKANLIPDNNHYYNNQCTKFLRQNEKCIETILLSLKNTNIYIPRDILKKILLTSCIYLTP